MLADPYCGVGTSLLSAQIVPDRIQSAIGIERNPFVAFIARSKLSWPLVKAGEVSRIGERVLSSNSIAQQATASSEAYLCCYDARLDNTEIDVQVYAQSLNVVYRRYFMESSVKE